MSKQFRYDEIRYCTGHVIEGYSEKVYTFTHNGSEHCLLANDIAAIAAVNNSKIIIDKVELSKWAMSPMGNPLPLDYIINAYRGIQEVAYFSLGRFEGVWMLISHLESCCTKVAEGDLDLIYRFFFSTRLQNDNLDDMLRLNGLVHVNGFVKVCSYSVNLAEWLRKQYQYDFGQKIFPDFSGKPFLQIFPLIYKDKEVVQNITDYTLTNCGIILKDDTNNYAFASYRKKVICSIQKLADSVYLCGNEILLLDKETLLRVPFDHYEQQGTLALISFGGTKMKCALDLGVKYSFHVESFQRLSEDGHPLLWVGEKLSMKEIKDRGLDHDLTVPWEAEVAASNAVASYKENNSSDFTDPSHKPLEIKVIRKTEQYLDSQILPVNPLLIKSRHVKDLYLNYFDKSIII